MASDKVISLASVAVVVEEFTKSGSCKVINPPSPSSVSRNTSKLISSHTKTKKKQKQEIKEKSKRKIIDKHESVCLFHHKVGPNLKNFNGERGDERHKALKKFCKLKSNCSKSDKPLKSPEKSCLKTSFHVAERFRRDRIRPCCFRITCNPNARIVDEKQSCRSARISTLKVQEEQPKPKKSEKPKHKGTKRHRNHCSKRRKETSDEKYNSLSPISMSPLPFEDLSYSRNISYEDIVSRDSFITESEEELDTLIKRTKERERSMQYGDVGHRFFLPLTIRDGPFQTSTPYHYTDKEDCSTVYTEDMDVSVHSLSTVVLTPHIGTDVYSPTASPIEPINSRRSSQDTIQLSDTESNCDSIIKWPKLEPYSPSPSPEHICQNYSKMKIKIETSQEDVKREIHGHPIVDIKKEDGDFIVKRELNSQCPLICIENSKTDIKKEKDSNYNNVIENG